MGNSLGGKKSAKVMKISGETLKIKTPVRAGSVLESCPGHVLLESEAVKQYGVRAKPMEPQQELKPRRLYFLVELPKVPEENNNNKIGSRRVRSGIQMSAKDRLESLRLSRRSASDLSVMMVAPLQIEEEKTGVSENGGGVRVRMRLPKAEVERLMAESKDGAEVAEKIAKLCVENGGAAANGGGNGDGGAIRRSVTSREKRVGFLPISDREIHHLTAAS
ncbi:hypothetical protein CASFOL_024372 [Castilleja foliolosa]|uniref:Plastid movement impaired 2 n=1 Tax=Castilleja foliolosa TaxID=1961234 RepID=A0ABD3CN40_9LAMI